MSTTELRRYPKRKRAEIDYYIDDVDDQDDSGDEKWEVVKAKRSKVTKSPSKLPKSKIFPFLELPPEIRNQIYAECLQGPPCCKHESTEDFVMACENTTFRPLCPDETQPNTVLHLRATQKRYRRVVELCAAEDAMYSHRGGSFRACCEHHARQENERAAQRMQAFRDPHGSHVLPAMTEPTRPVLAPKLLAVCKKIHEEAASVLYGQRFVFADAAALVHFLTDIGPATTRRIKHVQVNSWTLGRSRKNVAFYAASLMAAKHFTGLEMLRIDDKIGNHYWSARGPGDEIGRKVARKLFRDMYPWLHEVGCEQKDPLAALRTIRISEQNFGDYWRQPTKKERAEAIDSFRKEIRRLLLRH